MRVRKRKYTDDDDNVHTLEKYYVEFTDPNGATRSLAGFTDKAATEQLGKKLQRLSALRAVDEPPDVGLSQFIQGLPQRFLDNLARWNMIDEERAGGARTLDEHLEIWEKTCREKGNAEKTVQQKISRVRSIVEGIAARRPRDLDTGKIQSWLHDQVEQGKFGLQTRNYYLRSIRTFCRWMVRRGRMKDDPTIYIEMRKVHPDKRRALTPEECGRLLDATRENGRHHGMGGHERALLYETALTTGLRWSELRSLTVEDLDLDSTPPSVSVSGEETKNGKNVLQPLQESVVQKLRDHIAFKDAGEKVFHMWKSKGAPMVREDLKATGDEEHGADPIPAETSQGHVDFHALRTTFCTHLANAGTPVHTLKKLARHSDVSLTMKYYAHSVLENRAAALAELPDLTTQHGGEQHPTGTANI
ncbi:MAG: tyrosine-type recombinase/integrase [Planctomycetota bacterium]